MKNQSFLFEKNGKSSTKRIKLDLINKIIEYRFEKSEFDESVIKDIIRFVNAVEERYPTFKIPIYFNLGNIEIRDKLTYILFECICNYIIEYRKRNVYVTFNVNNIIHTEGIKSSPLLLLGKKQKGSLKKFIHKHKREIYNNHYRRILTVNENNDPLFLSKIMSEVDSFLKKFSVSKQYRGNIAEVIIELAGNVLEHALTDCLIDVDISDGYEKNDEEGSFYGVNITIVNFSENLLGHSIMQKLKQRELLNERHKKLLEAYSVHKLKFNEDYLEEDFFNIASFQHKISGRLSNEHTGGTGLTKLISNLEDYSDAYLCYVITGNRMILFESDYLSYNEEKWIGFNEVNDFLTSIPEKGVTGKSTINIPGTAYNFNFIMKKEE